MSMHWSCCEGGHHRRSPLAIVGMVIGGVALFSLIAFLLGWVVMSLWNALIPSLFHGPTLTYWQAIGLFILAHIFFGKHGVHHNSGRHGRGHHRHGYRLDDMPPEQRERIKARFEEELDSLPPEERDRIRRRWSSCCGGKSTEGDKC